MHRSTLVLLILFALLGGAYFYLQQPGHALPSFLAGTPTPTLTAPEFLVGPQQPSFSSIELTQPETGHSLLLQSAGGTWTMKMDKGSLQPASQVDVENRAGALRETQILRHLQGSPVDFGLTQPVLELRIEYVDGTQTRFSLGAQAATQSGYYALLENGEIVLLNAAGVEELLRMIDNPPFLFTPTPTELPSVTPTDLPASTPTPAG